MKQRQWSADSGRLGPFWGLIILTILLLPTTLPTTSVFSQSEISPGETPTEPEPPQTAPFNADSCSGNNCLYLPFLRQQPEAPSWFAWSRSEALSLYRSLYLPGESADPGWEGDLPACDPGDTDSAFQKAVLQRINYYRQAAGVPPLERLNPTYNRKAQAAALMMSRNQQLSHNPPASWSCYSEDGSQAAGSSNLYLGTHGPSAVSGYIRDPGAGNSFVGHRRWILYPQTREMGTGDIPPTSSYSPANALWVFGSYTSDSRPATRNPFVAWPPPGYIPSQVVYPYWSFSYPEADFSKAVVSLSRDGKSVPITLFSPVNGFGENTLVWKIKGMDDHAAWPAVSQPDHLTVIIQGVRINGQVQTFSYPVTIFSP